jgi:hypothetical protein
VKYFRVEIFNKTNNLTFRNRALFACKFRAVGPARSVRDDRAKSISPIVSNAIDTTRAARAFLFSRRPDAGPSIFQACFPSRENTEHDDGIRAAQSDKAATAKNSWNEMRILGASFQQLFLRVGRLRSERFFRTVFRYGDCRIPGMHTR